MAFLHAPLMTSSLLGISNQSQVNMDSRSPSMDNNDVASEKQRSCVDCHTRKTPLWRGGPAGPRSLCNACGIRYRKMTSGDVNNGRGIANKRRKGKKTGASLKLRLVAFGREMVLHRAVAMGNIQVAEKSRGKFGEEEEAAMLLMALSSGYV